MPQLTDLAPDVLLEIATLIRHGTPPQNRPYRKLWPLSLTCKLLNAVCAHWLFRRYRLVIRTRERTHRDLISGGPVPVWDADAVARRLAHFQAKAPFVRELVLTDHMQEKRGHPGFLPDEILPALLEGLQSAQRLTDVAIANHKLTRLALPQAIWDWLVSRRLRTLSFVGNVCPPEGAAPHPSVERLSVALYKDGSARFLDLIRPKILCAYYHGVSDVVELASFMPGADHAPRLRAVNMVITLPAWFETPLFNFSNVPLADVEVCFELGLECHPSVPAAWRRIKHAMPTIFVENLRVQYDVWRDIDSRGKLHRPPLADIAAGWKPRHSAHLQAIEKEFEEEVAMRTYLAINTDKRRP